MATALPGLRLASRLTRAPGPFPLLRQTPVTYFVMQVRLGSSAWIVRRRYKDFDVLYQNLCSAYGKAIVPPLPPKQMLKNESPEFLQRRSQLLASFLDGIFADKVLSMSAELCAFLECEAGSALTKTNAAISTCAAIVVTELAAAERLATSAATALDARETDILMLRTALAAVIGERDAVAAERDTATAARDLATAERDSAIAERDAERAGREAARDAAKAGRDQVLAMVCRGRRLRQIESALHHWASGTEARAEPEPEPDKANPLTVALTAAFSAISSEKAAAAAAPAAVAAADVAAAASAAVAAPQEAKTKPSEALLAQESAAPQTPVAQAAAPPVPSAPSEHAVKCGLLLKQGAGNKAFQERYFEMVTLGADAEYGAFLVYYESELKASVKGYISLDGASVSAIEHPTEPYAMMLTTPARRLSVLTPGVSPGPLKKGGLDGFLANFNGNKQQPSDAINQENAEPQTPQQHAQSPTQMFECPPSLEAKMNVMQKLDNWGRHALRNAMAQGPLDKPHITWTLAATSASELQAWLGGFASVLSEAGVKTPLGGYQHAAGRDVARTPVMLGLEEVM